MQSAVPPSLEIGPVAPAERAAALELLLGDWEGEDRRRQIAELLQTPADSATWDTFLAARCGGRIVAVTWGQLQPGRVAGLWLPRSAPGASTSMALPLLEALCRALQARDVQIALSLLFETQQAEMDLLARGGFARIATLEYMFSPEHDFPTECPDGGLEFVPYEPATHARLAAILQATYQQTLDCPYWTAARAIDDVLAGYRAAGVFDPRRWLVVRHQQYDVGCLLLADYPDRDQQELGYMGLRPELRGRGWGIQVVRHAQWLCRQAGRSRLVLCVDAANGPARRIYQAAGFHTWQRRVAHAKILQR